MKKYYFLLISALFLFSCKSSLPEVVKQQENQVQTKLVKNETDKEFYKLCREVAGYSLEKQQGILSMVSIPDSKLTNATVKFLKKHYVSGIILFKKNIENEKQLKQLIKETFEFWVRKRWVKEVNKACDKYIKTKEKIEKRHKKDQEKLNRYSYVAGEMIKEYKERYGMEGLAK
jgi:dGTP triphosphohydrolase